MPYKMKDGRWRAEKMIHGKRKSKVCSTKAEAHKWESEQTEAAWQKEKTPILTVFSWATAYLSYAKERFVENTYVEKVTAFRRLLDQVAGDRDICALSPGEALDVIRARAGAAGGNGANRDRKNFSAAWEWGKKHLGLPRENPFREVDKFAETRHPRYVPPEVDFWRAIECAHRPEHRDFVLLMLYTAARRGELLRLVWQDVDIEGRRLRLHTRKRAGGTLEADWLPLAAPAVDVLQGLPRASMFVFPNADGGQYATRQHLLKGMCRRGGVRPFGFHAVRHLSASILAREGVSLPIIQRILRHKNALTTARYLSGLGLDLPELDRVWEGRKKDVSHTVLHMADFSK
jgi:integrase